ncbi:MAG: carbohydrate ABC transporter permease [Oscillospiraceae bacterium]|nr:carbohydrate ABC transporter permease [Oscillospiraceae bacterium]
MLLVCFLCVFPLYWMIISSFKGEGEIFSASFWPQNFTFSNYTYAFSEMPIARMTVNSFILAISMTVLHLVTGILAAFAFIRYSFKGKAFFTILLGLAWLIPVQAIMIPNYVTIVGMGLSDNLLAVILPYAASAFAMLNLLTTFRSFPDTIMEAARLDGDSDLRMLWNIIMPNLKSGIASLGILLFITNWNEYLWPRLVMSRLESSPIQIGLRSFISSDTNLWGSLMAATTVSCIPILIIYLVLQRQIVDSFVRWGTK